MMPPRRISKFENTDLFYLVKEIKKVLSFFFLQYNFVTPLTSMVVTKPEATENTDEGIPFYPET